MNGMEQVQSAITRLIDGRDLNREEARQVMQCMMEGQATHSQIGSLLTALRMKGETVQEITGFAEAMRAAGGRVLTERSRLLDTCGTGGSGIHKINISTASAIISSSVSVRVAKHGNRSASGRAGSADVLEALGVNIHLTAEQAKACLEDIGICFLFAQIYHPSMKHAAAPRKELGIRTVFNMLGPLTNPAGADRQMLGLYDKSKTETIAQVLSELGLKRALVVSGHDGLDEISISGLTRISELRGGEVRTYDIHPADLGLKVHPVEAILGGDAKENAAIIRSVLQGERSAYRDIVLANSGACIYVSGLADSIAEGVRMAAEAVDTGLAEAKLKQLITRTGELSYVS
ncbi:MULTISPECIES: anthranilate phosphoribosyltransferase [Paenibacillus]|uniref:Anthranilate phosphoribosyltransferase n=1 Tax=Paenibacillus campinasensis TaxID=66347 RepID=A0A268F316_9BACL|nr:MULTISPECIES: anthranilate phosphoribosyltransferase [Paenibacillus]MUG65011.1 anthranilate phosphoribosyltransferase [Paenibacillus campinasensis]PAD79724.1 anthranilate phosphoribosyltransferase [Paenibacillus campinasensis]PAK53587.1 anthranilate phosphoribosyltransferase [Paenibacillus sp. 7541]